MRLINSCRALLFCKWTLEPVCSNQQSTFWLWFSACVNSHITLVPMQWAPSRPSLHMQGRDEIALQVLFACMPWRKLPLICQYASESVDSQLAWEEKKILLRIFYYTDFDKCTADEKSFLIPGDGSMLDSLLSHCADCAYVTSSWMTGLESRHTAHTPFGILCLVIVNILLLVANNDAKV